MGKESENVSDGVFNGIMRALGLIIFGPLFIVVALFALISFIGAIHSADSYTVLVVGTGIVAAIALVYFLHRSASKQYGDDVKASASTLEDGGASQTIVPASNESTEFVNAAAMAVDHKPNKELLRLEQNEMEPGERIICPACRSLIPAAATICRYCQTRMVPNESPNQSE